MSIDGHRLVWETAEGRRDADPTHADDYDMWRRRLGVEAIVIGDEAILTGDLAVVENIEFGDKVISNSEAIWATRLL